MQLGHLIEALPTVLGRIGSDVEVHGIRADSRRVRPGDLFVAIPGVSLDGHRFIAEAVSEGAVAVVGERAPRDLPGLPWGAFTYVRVACAREAWGWLCAAWEGFPSRKMTLVGVTGTDGKTTTVNLIYAILRAAGFSAGMVSTVIARIPTTGFRQAQPGGSGHRGEEEIDTGLHTTTPDPLDVQAYLARMVKAGATHAVLEVTSHGLAQHRVAGCDFDVAVITNITHEHLDFHGTMEAYQQAKARLFEGLTRSFRKPGVPKVAVLNRDDSSYDYLHRIPADRQIVYAVEEPQHRRGTDDDGGRSPAPALPGRCDVTAHDIHFAPDRTRFILRTPAGEMPIETPLVGTYNVSNVLAAAAVGVALDLSPEAIAEGIAAVRGVPGRMERIEVGQDFLAIVDFAHTPWALGQALRAARMMTGEGGRVIVVFGCAGLRDRAKRGMMGRIAGELADLVVITAEDPRTESLEEIMAASAAAATAEGKCEGVNLWRVPDRGAAILHACREARVGDVVISCGKGHEQSMCFGTTEYPWDDRDAMRLALRGETLDTLPTARRR
ncbi:MAG: Mur ligase family protein [Anaerolineae bacterium]